MKNYFRKFEHINWKYINILGLCTSAIVVHWISTHITGSVLIFPSLFALLVGAGLVFLFPKKSFFIAILSIAVSVQYVTTEYLLGIEVSSLHKLTVLLLAVPFIILRGINIKLLAVPCAYFICLFCSFLLSPDNFELDNIQIVKSAVGLSISWIFLAIRYTNNDSKIIQNILSVLPIICVIVGGLLALVGVRSMLNYEYTGAIRLQGSSIAPHLAMLGVIGAISSFAIAPARGNHNKIATVNIYICLLIIVASGTRGAIISILPLVCFLLFNNFRQKNYIKIFLNFITSSLLIIGITVMYLPQLEARNQNNTMETGLNTSGRSEAWHFFLLQAKESPVFGLGLGASTALNTGQIDNSFEVPHNEYIRTYIETGYFGLFIVWLSIITMCIYAIKHSQNRPPVVLAVCSFLIFSITDNTLSTMQFSLPFVLLIASSITVRDNTFHYANSGSI